MAKFTREDVLKLAKLAKLDLSKTEIDSFTHEIKDILGYVEQLQSVDVKGLEPTSQVTGLKNVTRSDTVINYGISKEELLKNVPEVKDGQIKVRRVL